ncbi:MAG: hypothetical protein QXO04_05120 [Nitrososphaerota archaeon]
MSRVSELRELHGYSGQKHSIQRKKSKMTQQKQMLKLICEEWCYTMHKI